MLAQRPLYIVIDQFALEGITSDQVMDEHFHLGIICRRATRKLARDTGIGVNLQDITSAPDARTRLVNSVKAVVIIIDADIRGLPLILVKFDAGNFEIGGHKLIPD